MFYRALKVSRTATGDEIKASYRKLALETHPDKNGGSTELFQKIQKAYEVIGNPEERAAYDAFLSKKRERLGGFVKPVPFEKEPDAPVGFKLADDTMYQFESSPPKLKCCGLRYGDVITFKEEPGIFVGLAADGFIYWCRDDTDYAVRMCEAESSFGLSSIKVLYRCNLSSGVNISSKPKKKRTAEEKAQSKSALEQMKEKLRNKERARMVSSRLETFEKEESDAREELEAELWKEQQELISLFTTFVLCVQSGVPVPYEGLRLMRYSDEKCASFGSPPPGYLGESTPSAAPRYFTADADEDEDEDGGSGPSSQDPYAPNSLPDFDSRGASGGDETEGVGDSWASPSAPAHVSPSHPLDTVNQSLESSHSHHTPPHTGANASPCNESTHSLGDDHSPGPTAPVDFEHSNESSNNRQRFTVTNVSGGHADPTTTTVPSLVMHPRQPSDISPHTNSQSGSPGYTANVSLAEKYMGQKKKNTTANSTPRYMQNTQAHSSRAKLGTPLTNSLGLSPLPEERLSPSATGSFRLSNYDSMTAEELLAQEAEFMKEFTKKRKQKK